MTVTAGRVYCDKCQEPIERLSEAWWEHVGWAKKRKGGGLHSLKLAVKTEAVVCPACMVRMEMNAQHGPGVASLF